MRLSKAQKLYIQHIRRDYSSWSTEELKQEYNRIGQELLLRKRPVPEERVPPGYPFASEMPNIQHTVDRFFDRRVPIQHAIWREERNLT